MIDAASARRANNQAPALSPAAVKFVLEIIEHNDAAASDKQVRVADVLKTLAADFGWKGGKDAFQTACARQLGRPSFTQKG